MSKDNTNQEQKVRLDKWLWAARFYKTRSIATQMIDGGKVHYNQQRVKSSKTVSIGANVTLNFNGIERTFIIEQISGTRREYEIAKLLYRETEESIAKHQDVKYTNRAAYLSRPQSEHRPNKKQRRDLENFVNSFKD